MLLLKSFLRKKTTKIYIVIFFILAVILIICNYGKNSLIDYANENYKGSFMYFESGDIPFQDVKNYSNIDDVYEAAVVKEGINYRFVPPLAILDNDISLSDNQILLPEELKTEYNIGDVITLELKNQSIEFVVQGFFDSKYSSFMYIVNDETISKIIETGIGEKIYFFTLKNWIYYESMPKNIEKDFGLEYVYLNIEQQNNFNINPLLTTFNLFITMIIIIFLIIGVVTIFNVISDEHKKNTIYRSLGYSKAKTRVSTLAKVIIIIIPILILLLVNLLSSFI